MIDDGVCVCVYCGHGGGPFAAASPPSLYKSTVEAVPFMGMKRAFPLGGGHMLSVASLEERERVHNGKVTRSNWEEVGRPTSKSGF